MKRIVDVKVVQLDKDLPLPTYACESDAGMDLYSAESVILNPGDVVKIKTGIAVQLPDGYAFEVSPRSGIDSGTHLRVKLGTIDAGYRGEIGITIENTSQLALSNVQFIHGLYLIDKEKYSIIDKLSDGDCYPVVFIRDLSSKDPEFHGAYRIKRGDRIAQLKLKEVPTCNWVITDKLDDSDRGIGGFGHTGV